LQRIHRLSQSPSRRTSGIFWPFPGVPPRTIRPQTQPGPAPGAGHHTQVPRPQRLTDRWDRTPTSACPALVSLPYHTKRRPSCASLPPPPVNAHLFRSSLPLWPFTATRPSATIGGNVFSAAKPPGTGNVSAAASACRDCAPCPRHSTDRSGSATTPWMRKAPCSLTRSRRAFSDFSGAWSAPRRRHRKPRPQVPVFPGAPRSGVVRRVRGVSP